MGKTKWRPLGRDDLPSVLAIADGVHVGLHERLEVFAEKLSLFPEGCRALADEGLVMGYGFSHPWLMGSIPPLDGFLGGLPPSPQCLHIHDVVVLPQARGRGEAAGYVGYVKGLAARMGITRLALVSVHGSEAFWMRLGFEAAEVGGPGLTAYGHEAVYMVCRMPHGNP